MDDAHKLQTNVTSQLSVGNESTLCARTIARIVFSKQFSQDAKLVSM